MALKVLVPTTINDARFVSSVVVENDHPVYNSGSTYALNDLVIYAHRRWKSLVGSNHDNTPGLLGGTSWNDLGPTNQWAIFDQKTSTTTYFTTSGGSPTWWTRAKPGPCTGVYVMGMVNVAEVKVQMFNGATLVWEGIATLDNTVIACRLDYFYAPFDFKTDMYFGPLPPYYNAEILVTLTPNTVGDTVKCGGVQFGYVRELGELELGVSVDFDDYSVKVSDGFGNWDLVERDFTNIPKYVLVVPRAQMRLTKNTMESVRATPCVYFQDDYELTPFNAYGFLKRFSLVLEINSEAYFSFDVQGM